MNLVKLGRIALDGTKVKANASKHKQVMGLRQFSMRDWRRLRANGRWLRWRGM